MLDVSAGTGEAALMALPIFGASGFVIGADISPAMLEGCACPDTRAVVLAGGR
jgi:ubiquinone/menaquinone biosynthesis C-methylase UbiE